VSKDTNRLMGHADEADGIEEYDNPLPDWWLGLFWFCIIWAIGYAVHYHFIADRSQEKGLAAEMAATFVRSEPAVPESTVAERNRDAEAPSASEAALQIPVPATYVPAVAVLATKVTPAG